MAEESGKGIALVILGIVAIIAIVGLVLLFTGARKAAGEFAVPAAREYGGAIKGITYPYARSFPGRAIETRAKYEDVAAQSIKKGGTVATYGDVNKYREESQAFSWNRAGGEVPATQLATENCKATEECKYAGKCCQGGRQQAASQYGGNCVWDVTYCEYGVVGGSSGEFGLGCRTVNADAVGGCCDCPGLQTT